MLIAKLTITLRDCGIEYNKSAELDTTKERGSVLDDGKVVRGLGTHFASQEAKERFDKLTARANEIRTIFGNKFGRGPLKGTYIISKLGEALEFIRQFESEQVAGTVVTVDEYNLNGSLSERTLIDWAARNKDALKRVPLGGKKEASDEGIMALEALAACPALAQETRDAVLRMASEARVGSLTRVDLKRGISLLDVSMDKSVLMAPRSRPEAVV